MITIVTSFNKKLWTEYAQKAIQTWATYLSPTEFQIKVWIDGDWPKGLPQLPNFEYKMLEAHPEFLKFIRNFSNHPRPDGLPSNQMFRFNFLPYWCKVFALTEELRLSVAPNVLLWLDADVITTEPIDINFLASLSNNFSSTVTWLDRGAPWGYGETGFVLFKVDDRVKALGAELRAIYQSGQLFDFREWHDAFVFSALLRKWDFLVASPNFTNNINKEPTALYPFEHSPLHPRLLHYKGPRKQLIGAKEEWLGSGEGVMLSEKP